MKRKELVMARCLLELSQKDVAEELKVTQARYSKIETGAGNPTEQQKVKLFELLKVRI